MAKYAYDFMHKIERDRERQRERQREIERQRETERQREKEMFEKVLNILLPSKP